MTVIYCDCCGRAIHEIFDKRRKSELYDYDLCTECKDLEWQCQEDLRHEYSDMLQRRWNRTHEESQGMQV